MNNLKCGHFKINQTLKRCELDEIQLNSYLLQINVNYILNCQHGFNLSSEQFSQHIKPDVVYYFDL